MTGSGSGFGFGFGEAIAKMLAAEGAAVVVHGRDVARTETVAKAIRSDGGRAVVLYLTGPLADYVSGATIRVDGGGIRSVH